MVLVVLTSIFHIISNHCDCRVLISIIVNTYFLFLFLLFFPAQNCPSCLPASDEAVDSKQLLSITQEWFGFYL